MRRSAGVCLGIVIAMWTMACRTAPASDVHVDRFAASVFVQPNGTVDVHETLAVRLADHATSFERVVALEHADRAGFVSASLDGHAIDPAGTGDVRIGIRGDAPLRVTWTFPPGTGRMRTFELRYVAEGAVALQGVRGGVELGVIPARRDYGIGVAEISLALADGLHMFDGTGVVESGWTLERTARGIAGARHNLAAREGGTLVAQITADAALVRQPQWQRDADWIDQFALAFVAGGAFILVVGIGILIIIRMQYPRLGSRRAATQPSDERPGDRDVVRRGLRVGGWSSVVLAAVCAAIVAWTMPHAGAWPQIVPLSILVVGLLFAGVSRRYV